MQLEWSSDAVGRGAVSGDLTDLQLAVLPDSTLPGEETFGRAASWVYSRLGSRFLGAFHAYVAEDVIRFKAERILDVGCGSGEVLGKIAARGTSAELCGVDPSPHMLRLAARRVHEANPQVQLNLMPGSSRHIPFEGSFDLIFTSLSYHHWADREQSAEYILSKLQPRGRFVIYEFDRRAMGFLRRWTVGKHALSSEEADVMGAFGAEKTVIEDSPFIKVVYRMTG